MLVDAFGPHFSLLSYTNVVFLLLNEKWRLNKL